MARYQTAEQAVDLIEAQIAIMPASDKEACAPITAIIDRYKLMQTRPLTLEQAVEELLENRNSEYLHVDDQKMLRDALRGPLS